MLGDWGYEDIIEMDDLSGDSQSVQRFRELRPHIVVRQLSEENQFSVHPFRRILRTKDVGDPLDCDRLLGQTVRGGAVRASSAQARRKRLREHSPDVSKGSCVGDGGQHVAKPDAELNGRSSALTSSYSEEIRVSV